MPEEESLSKIFLLEFFVDNIHYDLSNVKTECKSDLGQTCVKFCFLNYPPVEICEEDLCNNAGPQQASDITFKSGKSCLFSLRCPNFFQKCFTVTVYVLRKLKNGGCVEVGTSTINLGGSFTEVITAQQHSSSSTSKTVKGTYPLKDSSRNEIGNITVFVRLSNFGKTIVTQFQVGGTSNRSFLFRGVQEGVSIDIMGSEQQIRNIAPTSSTYPTSSVGISQCGGGSFMPGNQNFAPAFSAMQSSMQGCPGSAMDPRIGRGPCTGEIGMPGGFGGGYEQFGQGQFNAYPYGGMGQLAPNPYMDWQGYGGYDPTFGYGNPPMPDNTLEGKRYNQIDAEVNGHALNIKVLRKQKKQKQPPPEPPAVCGRIPMPAKPEPPPPPPKPPRPVLNLCDCDFPTPPGLIPPPTPPPPPPPPPKPARPACPLEMRDDVQYCMKEDCPLKYPQPPFLQAGNKKRPAEEEN